MYDEYIITYDEIFVDCRIYPRMSPLPRCMVWPNTNDFPAVSRFTKPTPAWFWPTNTARILTRR